MDRFKILTITFLMAIGVFALVGLQYCLAGQSTGTKPASVLLQEALYAEEIDGDLDKAIKIYDQIIKDKSAQRNHVAQAMYRQGMCYLKQQNEQRAQEIFQTLIAQYSEQTEIIGKVKPLLDGLGNTDPAALMPPETIFYAEIGSPGKQIETILNMLKGTPLENPLMALGGNNTGWQGSNPPANIIAGLLNPGMMAEFKKIQGVGIGITGISDEEEPPAIIVLFLGKSDALKGLLQMALTMAGKPMESLEGMQTVALPDGGCAVYDDTIVIMATQKAYAAGQLAWSVKQYKGMTSEPTLASSNKSFVKVPRKVRQENLLTIWIDMDRAFAGLKKVLPEGALPEEIRMANGFVNFDSIDDVMTFLSLEENGIAVEANVAFKDGQNSLAYNMIRTPNLNKAGFEAVPSNAIGLISFVLGDAQSPQAQLIGQKIQEETGYDIGKELYANIDQVTLFILPPDGSSSQANTMIPQPVASLGLAITSNDPEQTRLTLAKLLSAANALPAESTAGPTEPINGKYEIPLVEGQKLYCYMDQGRKTTVISLAPSVIESSLSAMNSRQSALTGGPLQNPLSKLSPSTSKLVLINVAGIVRMAQSNMGSFAEQNNLSESLNQLATSSSNTFLQLRTDEKPDNLNIRADVIGIPPINELFIPMMQLAQIMQSTGTQQMAEKQKIKTATVKKADQSPVIDGKEEQTWSAAPKYKLGNVMYSPKSSDEDSSAYYKVLWDKDNLYVLVDVTDDNLTNDSGSDLWYEDDCIEVFIDADNSRSGSYDKNDYQFHFDWDKNNPTMAEDQHGTVEGVEFAMVTKGTGYRTEIKFPWTTLGTTPSPGTTIGFEVHVNDDDSGDRTKLAWSGTTDVAYEDSRAFGRAELAGLIGWWKLDEKQGDFADDSSGNNRFGRLMGDPKWQPSGGKIGGALEFDGDGDYIDLGTNLVPDITGQITVTAWIKVNAFNYDYTAIITKGDSAWRLQRDQATDHLEFACSGLDVPNMQWSNVLGNVNVNDGQWHHAAGVYDGEMLYLYVDGKLDVSSKAAGTINTNDQPVYIGENAEQQERFWNGLIDDVRIYNYALSEEEIMTLSK
jgi:tetratricopeptide (TPR) repeat protein